MRIKAKLKAGSKSGKRAYLEKTISATGYRESKKTL